MIYNGHSRIRGQLKYYST